ncbi:MAG: hypothetical protein SGPRY_002914, partial [Prymnesium sp.]
LAREKEQHAKERERSRENLRKLMSAKREREEVCAERDEATAEREALREELAAAHLQIEALSDALAATEDPNAQRISALEDYLQLLEGTHTALATPLGEGVGMTSCGLSSRCATYATSGVAGEEFIRSEKHQASSHESAAAMAELEEAAQENENRKTGIYEERDAAVRQAVALVKEEAKKKLSAVKAEGKLAILAAVEEARLAALSEGEGALNDALETERLRVAGLEARLAEAESRSVKAAMELSAVREEAASTATLAAAEREAALSAVKMEAEQAFKVENEVATIAAVEAARMAALSESAGALEAEQLKVVQLMDSLRMAETRVAELEKSLQEMAWHRGSERNENTMFGGVEADQDVSSSSKPGVGGGSASAFEALELRLHEAKLMRETKEHELISCQDELAKCKMELLNLRLAVEEEANATTINAGGEQSQAKQNMKQNMDKVRGIFSKKKNASE